MCAVKAPHKQSCPDRCRVLLHLLQVRSVRGHQVSISLLLKHLAAPACIWNSPTQVNDHITKPGSACLHCTCAPSSLPRPAAFKRE